MTRFTPLWGGPPRSNEPAKSASVSVTTALTGVAATGAIGSFVVHADNTKALTGVAASSAIGSFVVHADNTKALTGVAASSAIGSLVVHADNTKALTGVSAIGKVNRFPTTIGWNPADYDSADLTLSNNNLTITATNTGAGGGNWYAGVRATLGRSTGKYYFEIDMNGNTGNAAVGIATAAETTSGQHVGHSSNSIGMFVSDGSVLTNNLTVGNAAAGAFGNIVGVAVDLDNQRIWYRLNGNPFIVAGSVIDITVGSPSASFSFSGFGAGLVYPMVNTLAVGDFQTANFGASPFTAPIPSGFTSWDDKQTLATQTYTPVYTWNPHDKAPTVALSSGNLVATDTAAAAPDANVRGSFGRSTGKFYFEITEPTTSHSPESSGFGFANAAASLDSEYAGQTLNSVGYYKFDGTTSTGEVDFNNAFVDTAGPAVSTLPQTWGVAVDIDNGRWWIRVGTGGFIKNGVTIDITATTPSDSFPLPSISLSPIYPFLQLSWVDTWTVNFGATSFTAPIPIGFTSWDASQVGVISLSSVAATGAIGILSVTASATKALTGVAASGVIGSLTSTATIPLTGVAATGAIGTLSVTASATKSLTGVAASGAIGSLTSSSTATIPLTGVSATGAIGTLSVTASATKALTGVAASGAIGSLTSSSTATISLTGVAATGAIGTLSITSSATKALTGVAASGVIGSLTSSSTATIALTGVAATGAVGALTTAGSTTITLTGTSASGAAGTLIASSTATILLSGVAATGAGGTPSITVAPTLVGVSATGSTGTLVPVSGANATVALIGVVAISQIGILGDGVSSALQSVLALGASSSPLVTLLRSVPSVAGSGAIGNVSFSTRTIDGAQVIDISFRSATVNNSKLSQGVSTETFSSSGTSDSGLTQGEAENDSFTNAGVAGETII